MRGWVDGGWVDVWLAAGWLAAGWLVVPGWLAGCWLAGCAWLRWPAGHTQLEREERPYWRHLREVRRCASENIRCPNGHETVVATGKPLCVEPCRGARRE